MLNQLVHFRACNLMVETTTHNGVSVGSIPTKLIFVLWILLIIGN